MKLYLSENIHRYRKSRNLTQAELAGLVGVSPQAVSKWENRVAYPDLCLLPTIARLIGVTLDELLLCELTFEIHGGS